MKRLYCECCLRPLKTIRDIYDSIDESEYYSRDCECGHYDDINYHLRNYVYLSQNEVISIKRNNKIDQIFKSQ